MEKKIFLKFLLLSIIFHCAIVALFSIKIPHVFNNEVEISWKISMAPPTEATNLSESIQKMVPKNPKTSNPIIHSNNDIPVPEIIEKKKIPVTEDTTEAGPFWYSPLAMSKQKINLDSLETQPAFPFAQKLPPLFNTAPPGIGGDKRDKDIFKRNMGHEKTVPVSSFLLKGAQMLKKKLLKEKKPELNFIPTRVQISAFKTIWEKTKATDQDIYTNLDTSIATTSEELNGVLARLERRGFLTRKIVSPRNEFTIMTPFGAKAIEMSPTNKRNRIFEYKSRIEKDHVLRFLNAALYQVENGMKRDFFSTQDSLSLARDLKSKILLLSQEKDIQ
jgi:hypothetical protein